MFVFSFSFLSLPVWWNKMNILLKRCRLVVVNFAYVYIHLTIVTSCLCLLVWLCFWRSSELNYRRKALVRFCLLNRVIHRSVTRPPAEQQRFGLHTDAKRAVAFCGAVHCGWSVGVGHAYWTIDFRRAIALRRRTHTHSATVRRPEWLMTAAALVRPIHQLLCAAVECCPHEYHCGGVTWCFHNSIYSISACTAAVLGLEWKVSASRSINWKSLGDM